MVMMHCARGGGARGRRRAAFVRKYGEAPSYYDATMADWTSEHKSDWMPSNAIQTFWPITGEIFSKVFVKVLINVVGNS